MSESVKVITSKAEFDQLLASGSTVIVDFYADWCGPCRMISPVFVKLAGEKAKEGVQFCKLDIDKIPEVAQEYRISSIPAFKVFKGGEVVGDLLGANQSGLVNLVQTHAA